MSDFEKKVRVQLKKAGKRPLEHNELKRRAGIGKKDATEYRKTIERMTASGEIVEKNRRVMLSKSVGAKPAIIVKVKNTFGFARIEGEQRDVFVPGSRLMGTFPGDRVMVKLIDSDGELDAAEVLSVLQRANVRLSGSTKLNSYGELQFIPDNSAFAPMLVSGQQRAATDGEKVVATIKQNGDSHRDCRAVIEKEFGSAQLAKNCCDAILSAYNIEREFPPEVIAEAERVAKTPIEDEILTRTDLRNEPIFTIDGADTKDIDDAVSVKKTAVGWELGVHIADVSYYVKPNTLLDAEAFHRATSVYFADSVIPMLPKALSNGACSLNPNEDRLAFSAIIDLDNEGAINHYRFFKSVIRSRVKGVYSEVNSILAGDVTAELQEKYKDVIATIPELASLAIALKKRRFKRGSMELSSVESKIIVDENGVAADIKARVSGQSENIIEELMLTANEAAATLALENELPFVFRIHEQPSPEKLLALKELLDAVGLPSGNAVAGVKPAELSKILSAARETAFGAIVNSAMLRAMQKARYNEKNLGHYGLALENYAHFTSPIRRYPDLAIHRIITAFLKRKKQGGPLRGFGGFVSAASKQSSAMELNAMSVERSCEDCYKAEYMSRHLGEKYIGIVTSAAVHGVYVRLENTVEGLIRAEALGEGMLYDGKMQYCSADGKRRIRVGESIAIIVAGAEVSTGRVDFTLADA